MTFKTDSIVGSTFAGPQRQMNEGKSKAPNSEIRFTNARGSLVNNLNIINYKGLANDEFFITNPSTHFDGKNASDYRNPTGTAIVRAFDGTTNRMVYKPEDFIFMSGYGNLPNNHLITLRRFPQPCYDDITNTKINPIPDVGRALTYIDGVDNKMEELFSFSTGFNWKEFKSEIQTVDRKATEFGKGKFDLLKFSDTTGRQSNEALQGAQRTAWDPYNAHKDNYTWGPIDVIDSMMTRERGLKFDHPIKITCNYTIRSYNGINTKMVFLDLLGNILNMSTNKAPFWGGATRFTGTGGWGAGIGDPKLLESGDLGGFIKSMVSGLAGKLGNTFSLDGLKTLATNIGTGILGSALDKLGRPELYAIKSLLSGESTGEWHLTIGNPFNPTMMIGNLILEDTKITPLGPLTVDDVPSMLKVEFTLKHAMPRDKFGIQSMFNEGKGRYYSSDVDFINKKYYRNQSAESVGARKTTNQIADTEIDSLGKLGVDIEKEASKDWLKLKAATKTF